MKKLCFIINHISSGAGTERVAINIINGLAERGHDITLVTLWNSGESFFELNERVRTISLFEEKLPLYRNYLKLVLAIRRFLKDGNFDIVVNIETMLTLLVSPAVRGLGIAHVNWEHYNFTASSDSMLRPVARYVAAWTATAVVTLTEADTRMWQNRTRPRARMKTINNPLPFRKPDYHYHPDSRVVLAVGRLFHQKGFDLLLQTWHQVIGKHPDWTLQIVGSGEEEQALKAQARELTLEDSVEFHPHTKNIEAFYDQAGIFCLSSRFEGFGMVLIEAAAHGVPLASFDCLAGPAEIIDDEHNGLLAEAENTQALAEILERLMSDESLRSSYSRRAYDSIDRFKPEIILPKWEALFEELSMTTSSTCRTD